MKAFYYYLYRAYRRIEIGLWNFNDNTMRMNIDTLLPKRLDKTDSSYKTVIELNEVLDLASTQDVRNVAVTGPYGSGKSSVLKTLMADFKDKHVYLPISLATLKANDESMLKNQDDAEANHDETWEDALNRKIEYSILQQIVYREKTETVANSRLKRIAYLPPCRIACYALCGVLTVLAIAVAFEPKFLRIDSLCGILKVGTACKVVIDFICVLWLMFVSFCVFKYIFKSYSNSRLNKLNLKNGEISVSEENSIFNKHLDEILYFFQVTNYDVVIIEDLDRFNTTGIFLKLRELNQLINESKIVGRHITFVYAVKDDMFKDEERTKFFDYITTVIPVINSSNSKDKLYNALKDRGFEKDGISDDDLSEIAFFILDMRILTNIVNEYAQYREKLCASGNQKLDKTKLLAMIVYKNYCPKDFSELHCRRGKVYSCISKKLEFVELASAELDKKRSDVSASEKLFVDNMHIQESELRKIFLFHLCGKVSYDIHSIILDGNEYDVMQMVGEESLFNKLISKREIKIRSYYYGVRTEHPDFKGIDAEVHYSERLEKLRLGGRVYAEQYKAIERERIAIRSLPIKKLLSDYHVGASEPYKKIGLSPMQDVFIRRGFIDEEYYDYISYFYEGMMTSSDRELLLSIKREIPMQYDYHIDKIENFVKELKDYMFESDAILNIELLDYLACTSAYKDDFEHFMVRLERSDNMPIGFIAQYYIYGKCKRKVFEHIINWDSKCFWRNGVECKMDFKASLCEAYLYYCGTLSEEPQLWLNENYDFMANQCRELPETRVLELLRTSKFMTLSLDNDVLLNHVIESSAYVLNAHNLVVIIRHLCEDGIFVPEEALNYTRVMETSNNNVIGYVQHNIGLALECFKDSDKDESCESILYLINNPSLDAQVKTSYLRGQHSRLLDFGSIENDDLYKIAVEDMLIEPSWANVVFYWKYIKEMSQELFAYIAHFSSELSVQLFPDELQENEADIYESLFYNNELPIDKYSALIKSFKSRFPLSEAVATLERERLLVLVNNDKIPFADESLEIMSQSQAYVEYLEYHSEAFIDSLSEETYIFSSKQILALLKSSCFSDSDKILILDDVEARLLFTSEELIEVSAHLIISLGARSSCLEKDKRLELLTAFIRLHKKDSECVTNTLRVLGGQYAELTENKRPLIEITELNDSLLSVLKDAGYISSFAKESRGDGYRVIPRRKK